MLSPSLTPIPAVACAAACLTAAVTVGGVFSVWGTTAVPAAAWAIAAALAVAAEMGCRAAGGLTDPAVAAAARLAVVSLSLCPAMSLFGAKRPQHGVWQLIVATLAVVLVMPAASALLIRPGSLPDVHLIERCFMPLLVLVGWMNFAGTRRAGAATCAAIGQLLLLRAFLPGVATDQVSTAAGAEVFDATAVGLVLLGVTLAAALAWRRSPAGPAGPAGHLINMADAINRPFLALRETLGAAWTLRIAERFNTVAATRGWPCRLRFCGFESGGDPADTFWHRDALRAFQALARRFVTDIWLARHGWPATLATTEAATPIEAAHRKEPA